jgi:hypothetical protein
MRPYRLTVPLLVAVWALVACGVRDSRGVAPTVQPSPALTDEATTRPTDGPVLPTADPSKNILPEGAPECQGRAVAPNLPLVCPTPTPILGNALPEGAPECQGYAATPVPPLVCPTLTPTVVETMPTSIGVGVPQATTSAPPENAGPTLPPSPPSGPITITINDNQRTFQFAVGETFTLDLGGDFDWQLQVGDERIITRVDTGVAAGQGVYKALATGRTELTAAGDPVCRRATPACMMPSVLFQITLVVR